MADENTETENDNAEAENDNRGQQFAFNCALSAGCCVLSILFIMFSIVSIISTG